MKTIKKIKKSSQVPFQFFGYSLQITRFLSKLLEIDPDWTASLEVFEDVGAESASGNRIAEQTKSGKKGNPISDNSVDLWKTFSNWIYAAQNGEIDINKTSFEIFVSKKRTGEIVKSFAEADTVEKAQTALQNARMKLWGQSPEYKLKSKISKNIKNFVGTVLDKNNEEIACAIIKNFSFQCGSGDSYKDIKAKMVKKFVPGDILDDVILYALGWVQKNINSLIENEKPAIIAYDAFHIEITSFVRKHDQRTILTSFAGSPSTEKIQEDLKIKTYVRQLEIVDSNKEDKIRAIIDFFKSTADRARWSAQGLIHETSFDEFEDGLRRTWDNLKTKNSITLNNKTEIEQGRHLYAECSLHKGRLEGYELPEHFIPGSFHLLSDQEIIGWHPDYKNKLKN